jgi:L-amino acid N-acyltransferase YncA
MIRKMTDADAGAVLEIYGQGIAGRLATFETEAPRWEDWIRGKHPHSRFVYIDRGAIAGWALIAPVSERKAYAGVAEVSVYVHEAHRRKGIGDRLLKAVIESSEEHGIWTLSAAIIAENEASIELHKKNGFGLVGRRERIAMLDGVWRDTVVLERRSPAIG